MKDLDFEEFEKFMAAMLEGEGANSLDAELSIKRKSGKQETFINGSALSVLLAADELVAKVINSVCSKTSLLSRKGVYMAFCENLKELLELQEAGKE